VKLKLDENMSTRLKSDLGALGFDVETVLDEGLQGRDDSQIASHCGVENRMLLTLDVGFGDLRKYRPGTHPGIILLRPLSTGPSAVKNLLLGFLSVADLTEFVHCLVVVEPGRVRVRRPEAVDEPR
jgi:predicted nuclease of predicted toxin-antitoxin system